MGGAFPLRPTGKDSHAFPLKKFLLAAKDFSELGLFYYELVWELGVLH